MNFWAPAGRKTCQKHLIRNKQENANLASGGLERAAVGPRG